MFIAPPVRTSMPAPKPGLIPGHIFSSTTLSTTHLGVLAKACWHSVFLVQTHISEMEA